MGGERIAAVVLAAGRGRRMESDIQKQFMILNDKPLIYYALKAFEDSPVDEIILVTGKDEIDFCKNEIVDKYFFQKVARIVEGGNERYHSVFEGLKAAEGCDLVLIHDGARPLVTGDIIKAAIEGAKEYGACVAAMPVKDTIKVGDELGYSIETPDRSKLWQVQTPQAFSYELVYSSYIELMKHQEYQNGVTDDAMVVESIGRKRVKLIPGSYANIKVTTPEDIVVAEALLRV